MDHTATYSPEDNKLRLYPAYRLDAEGYARMKAKGFIWAPKQELFVAPMWTPGREDLLIEMCGEIGDEDTSLVDRAEERAERFEEYSDKRAADAERLHSMVDGVAERFAGGQPILVGHHSEKRARKDAERIENGMRKAISMWETSKYWEQRARGALSHAKYKERPDVRARRIKGLEADLRKTEKTTAEATKLISLWANPEKELTLERARGIANFDHISRCFPLADYPREAPASQYEGMMSLWSALDGIITPEQARDIAVPVHERGNLRRARWINHINNRLAYERAMLAEGGGLITDKFDIEIGGKVLVRGEWVVVLKINKAGGKINSLATNRRYVSKVGIEEVKDYQAPEEGTAAKVKKAMALPPLCNYPGEGIAEATKEQWDHVKGRGDTAGTETVETETAGRHRRRVVMAFIARKWGYTGPGSDKQWGSIPVFIADEKRKDPPKPTTEAPVELDAPERVEPVRTYQAPEPTKFDDLKEALKEGVKVVVAPQLFPTPPEIAAHMAELAELEDGLCVLEPSAGTGNLIKAVLDSVDAEVLAYEINQGLCSQLEKTFPSYKCQVRRADFLEVTDFQGQYPRIIMNPPFENGVDIKHINHALTFLRPGGRLVALCANGPRQQAAFKDRADHWEVLPEGSFKSQGTGVNVALMVMTV